MKPIIFKRYKQALEGIVFEYKQEFIEEKTFLEKLMYTLAKEALKESDLDECDTED